MRILGLDKHVFLSYNTTPAEEEKPLRWKFASLLSKAFDHMDWPRGFGSYWPHISVGGFKLTTPCFVCLLFFLRLLLPSWCFDRFFGDHIFVFEVRVLTTSLTIVRCGLRGDSSTREHENVRFGWQNSTKKHYLSLEKRKNRSWGGRGRKFKSCHSDHIECS